jgi:hypothetical protein
MSSNAQLYESMSQQANYQLPNGLIKVHVVRRWWGQCHPQGANSGSNGKLKLMLNSKQLPSAHPYPMLANVTTSHKHQGVKR